MRLSFFIMIFLLSFSLQAEEEKKENPFQLLAKDIYFQPGGGLRVRYDLLREATGGAFSDQERESQATHRAQLDFKLYKGEYIETFFRFINTGEWGGAAGDTNGGQHDGFSKNNGLLVNQAWALWKVDDLIGIRFGRTPLHLGLGYTYGANDWFNVPYSFDLFDFVFDWPSVELSVIVAKIQELSTVANQTLSPDPEENHFIVNADIHNLIDVLSIFNFSFVQVNRDIGSPDGGVTLQNGLNMQRLSLEAEIKGKRLFGSSFISYVTGSENVALVNQVGGVDNLALNQLAFDLKAGYSFPAANDLRFWAGFHYDSGDSDTSDSSKETYDSFFYDVYGQSGLMDFIRWGNLTFYRLGMDVHLTTELTLGGEWLSFSKSDESDGIQYGQAGRFISGRVASSDITLGTGKDIGNEFDLWLDYEPQSGMKLRTTISTFFPGGVFETAASTSNSAPSSTISQFIMQIGYFF